MKRLKYLSALCAMFIIPLVATSSSYATSDYDNVIKTGGTFDVKNSWTASGGQCGLATHQESLHSSWSSYITDPSKYSTGTSPGLISSAISAFNNALENGRGWSVTQLISNVDYQTFGGADMRTGDTSLLVAWSGSNSDLNFHTFTPDGSHYLSGAGGDFYYAYITYFNYSNKCDLAVTGLQQTTPWIQFDTPNATYTEKSTYLNFNIIYPEGYEGVIPEDQATDNDNDGLNEIQEQLQGTSDNLKDTDGDGINDLKESIWLPDRDEVFCGNSECAYPDPTKKDLYVQIDWINDGSRDYKPSAGQLEDVVDSFANQNIIAHFDIGQYGGGEQIASSLFSNNDSGALIFAPSENEDSIDFYDLKNGATNVPTHFDAARKGVWHYMITSPTFKTSDGDTSLTRTGVSYPGDDDSIVSIERIEDLNPTNLNAAISATIMHELGHNLCLSDSSSTFYPDQPSQCVYSEIDKDLTNNPSVDYVSAMNYRYQFNTINYSHGTNGTPDDHDDWSAVNLGMGDFVNSIFEWSNIHYRFSGPGANSNQLSREEMIDALQY